MAEVTKVAFPDFDGVFTCTGRSLLMKQEYDPIAAGLISRVLKEGDYRIVVSSTWRIGATFLELATYLKVMNIRVQLHEDFSTKRLQCGQRGYEIQEWLCRHPEVTEYVIIDDDADMLPEQFVNFIQCDNREGFGAQQYWSIESRFDDQSKSMTYVWKPATEPDV